MSKRQHSNKGFTIIELMVATLIFSVIIVVITAGIVQMGRSYMKGLNEARTLDAARAVIDEVAQGVQFAGGVSTGTSGVPLTNGASKGYCVGNRMYSYQPGALVAGTQHALVVSDITSPCNAPGVAPISPLTNPLSGRELLGDRMRVANFTVFKNVVNNIEVYDIKVRVVYGDDELLCSPTVGNCGNNTVLNAAQLQGNTDLKCKDIRAGQQFCATVELSTTAERRI